MRHSCAKCLSVLNIFSGAGPFSWRRLDGAFPDGGEHKRVPTFRFGPHIAPWHLLQRTRVEPTQKITRNLRTRPNIYEHVGNTEKWKFNMSIKNCTPHRGNSPSVLFQSILRLSKMCNAIFGMFLGPPKIFSGGGSFFLGEGSMGRFPNGGNHDIVSTFCFGPQIAPDAFSG